MIQPISALKGFAMEASDGRMGNIVDFLFDDASWKVRWLVVDCGTWLKRRKVLIHPSAVSYVNLLDEQFEVNLTKARVEGSPEWGEHQPVSQRMQNRLYDYYGWDPLWGGPYLGAAVGGMASPIAPTPYLGFQTGAAQSFDIDESELGEPHLRSVVEVIGYHIHALDGDIGHVEDLLLDEEDWRLRYFVVDTRDWWFGKHVLIEAASVKDIEWSDRHVFLDVSRERVKSSPPWDPMVSFNELYRKQLHEHYGWPLTPH